MRARVGHVADCRTCAVKSADTHTVLPPRTPPPSAAVLRANVPIGGRTGSQVHGGRTLPALPCKYFCPHPPQQMPGTEQCPCAQNESSLPTSTPPTPPLSSYPLLILASKLEAGHLSLSSSARGNPSSLAQLQEHTALVPSQAPAASIPRATLRSCTRK